MAWIFSDCQDKYGGCIRQYCVFALTVLLFIFCLVSVIKTTRKCHHYNFQTLPLVINALATFAVLYALSQKQQENIYLIMLVIQIYSYSLLAYSYVGLYMLGTKRISKQQFRKFKIGFAVFSILILLSIIFLLIIQGISKLQCHQSHGIGNLILFLIEIPLYVASFVYIIKTKNHIHQMEERNHQNQGNQIKLIGGEDEYIKIRYHQANLMIISFTLSIAIHLATVIMFFIEKTSCSEGKYISTENLYEVMMFSLFDAATILPHITIPIILYLIPACHSSVGDTIVITPIKVNRSEQQPSNTIAYDSDFECNQKIKDMAIRKSPRLRPQTMQHS